LFDVDRSFIRLRLNTLQLIEAKLRFSLSEAKTLQGKVNLAEAR
jgi:hypothetical protein